LQNDAILSALVFTRTKHGADKVAQGLSRAGIRAEAIHGNKSQNARQRALQSFKNRQTRILVATDIAARGIDIDELTHVINFELPNVPETYVHRIGRTGRAGASGIALSFCDAEEKEFLHDIQKLLGGPIPVVEDHPHVMHASISSRPVAQAPSFAGRDGSRSNNGRNGSSDRGGRGRDQNGSGNNGRSNGGGRGRDNGGRDNNGSGNQRRDGQRGDNQRTSLPPIERTERPERTERAERPEIKRPEREVKHAEPEMKGTEQAKRPEPSVSKRPEQAVKRPEVNKRHEPQTASRPDPSRPEKTEDGGLPFRINQSSGDEKW
jgi:ATP-dependent RNA helicase RhlE